MKGTLIFDFLRNSRARRLRRIKELRESITKTVGQAQTPETPFQNVVIQPPPMPTLVLKPLKLHEERPYYVI